MIAKTSPYILLGAVLGLLGLGFSMLVSVGPYVANGVGSLNGAGGTLNPNAEAWKQAGFAGVGLLALGAGAFLDYRGYARWSWVAYVLIVIALALCLMPHVGVVKNGAKRWIRLGSIILQPSEFAKPVVIATVAAWCAKHRELRGTFLAGFAYPLLIVLLPVVLIGVETDLGNATLLAVGSLVVLFAAGTRPLHLAVLVLGGASALAAAVWYNPERMGRILAFWDLEKYKSGDGLQQWLSLTAFASGGEWGLGIGNSRQKMWSLPYPNTDFISPIIGEELGLWACMLMVLGYVCITLAAVAIAIHAPDRFGKLLGFGLAILIGFQTVIHLGVTTGMLPNKGMPLPFVSAGGSNLVCLLFSVGVLFNIYRQARHLDRECDPVLRNRKITPSL